MNTIGPIEPPVSAQRYAVRVYQNGHISAVMSVTLCEIEKMERSGKLGLYYSQETADALESFKSK